MFKTMYTAVKGIYENGILTLLEPAPNLEKSEVIVIFLSSEKPKILKERESSLILIFSGLMVLMGILE